MSFKNNKVLFYCFIFISGFIAGLVLSPKKKNVPFGNITANIFISSKDKPDIKAVIEGIKLNKAT